MTKRRLQEAVFTIETSVSTFVYMELKPLASSGPNPAEPGSPSQKSPPAQQRLWTLLEKADKKPALTTRRAGLQMVSAIEMHIRVSETDTATNRESTPFLQVDPLHAMGERGKEPSAM